jgi:Arc/MetJ family transcription regulator
MLPEPVLRALVRDLVREQFQGDLGLHITRNIRKLVKSEIARELELREKD